MKKQLHIISIICIICNIYPVLGQQEPQFTQYNDNILYYNPAYAGSRGTFNISGIHRQQWVGIDGAPITQSLFFHSPLRYESVGLGLSLINDKVGPLNSTWVNADFSYSLKFKNASKLAFGVKAGMNIMNGRFSEINTNEANDPIMSQNFSNKVNPNIGLGIYYHANQWYAGFAVPKIVQPKSNTPNTSTVMEQRHYYFMAGGYFNVNRMIKLRPSTMLKITEQAPLALDVSLACIFYDKIWVGANYRLLESAGAFFQILIDSKFKIGYSFDLSTSKLIRHNYGTHEILLTYDLFFKKDGVVSPRFF